MFYSSSPLKKWSLFPAFAFFSCLSQFAFALDIQEMVLEKKFWPSKPKEVQKFYKEDNLKWLTANRTTLFTNDSQNIRFNQENRWNIDEATISFSRQQRVATVSLVIKEASIPLAKIIYGINNLYPSKKKNLPLPKPLFEVEDPFINLTRSIYYWKVTSKDIEIIEDIHNLGSGALCYCCLEVASRNKETQYYQLHFIAPCNFFGFNKKMSQSNVAPQAKDPAVFAKNLDRSTAGTYKIKNIPMVIASDNSTRSITLATVSRLCQYYGFSVSDLDLQVAFGNQEQWLANNWIPTMKKFAGILNASFESIKEVDTFDHESVIHQFINPYNIRMKTNSVKKKNPRTPITDYGGKSFSEIMILFDKEELADVRLTETDQGKVFFTTVKECVSKGFPLLWVVQNKLNPEYKGSSQSDIVRLITGISVDSSASDKGKYNIIYTSPVGYKQEKSDKASLDDQYSMPLEDALIITKGLFKFIPSPVEEVEIEEEVKDPSNK